MALSEMMVRYKEVKAEYPDCLIFFRLGDFYELFFEDAVLVSGVLELTLTGRECGLGKENRAPMCGVPYHAVDGYIQRLVDRGYKVAICEQLTQPGQGKGLLKRGVVRVVTAGTALDNPQLPQTRNLYLLSVCQSRDAVGYAAVDVSTGGFFCGQLPNTDAARALLDIFVRVLPQEIIADSSCARLGRQLQADGLWDGVQVDAISEWWFIQDNAADALKKHFRVKHLQAFGVEGYPAGLCAAGALMRYLTETQKNALAHIANLRVEPPNSAMQIDANTRRNLEILRSVHDNKKATLLHVLDQTITAMGGRALQAWLNAPLQDIGEINARLDAVAVLVQDHQQRHDLKEALSGVKDMERLAAKLAYGTFNARDAQSLIGSFGALPAILAQLRGCDLLAGLAGEINTFEAWYAKLHNAFAATPPTSIKDGGLFATGYHTEVDELRALSKGGEALVEQLAARERAETGIKNLRISNNRVFGYYIEVGKSHSELVPYRYTRKQTTANAERYITEELKEMEEKIVSASDRQMALELELFLTLRQALEREIADIQRTAAALAVADVLCGFAGVAASNEYVRPTLCAEPVCRITQGRHPVVESVLGGQGFVANDTGLDPENRVMVLTGPNMAGKSTYIRQVALITLMAHVGCFVPAQAAEIGLTDRIFTRIGASDDLASGQSTFMVEMSEVAHILRNATSASLMILDEIGRGTATHDGLAIARAVVESLAEPGGGRTLFATHYHELTELEDRLSGVKNFRVAVSEQARGLVFLHRIERGGADQSYGIHVAQLAGVPQPVVARAWQLLQQFRTADVPEKSKKAAPATELPPALMPREHPVIGRLRELDVLAITPMQGLQLLADLKEDCKY